VTIQTDHPADTLTPSTGTLKVSGITEVTGSIKLDGSSSGVVTIQPAAAAGTYTLTLPTTDGAASEFLQTDGSGVLTWAAASGSGTVTSVSFTGGIVSVANPTTTPAFTVAGTSGGIPYFSGATTWATSAALAANALVVGGGAGVAPATVTTGTGVVTALGVNTGTAGAFVVNGGDLGTPSSGTVTNLTGTASININGTVGATTPAAGSFTTLGLTGVKYSAAGSAQGAAITDYFTSTISLDASSLYEIDAVAYFLKTTAGTVIWTWAFSSAPDVISSFYTGTPTSGFTTTTITGNQVTAQAHVQTATTMAHAASGSLTTAVYHLFRFRVMVETNGATTIQLRSTQSAGTLTPQAGSYMRATKVL
jgi:hypothetical protein